MKVQIRKPIVSDAKELWELVNDREVVKQLSGYPYPCPFGKVKKEIADGIKYWKTGRAYSWTILFNREVCGFIFFEYPTPPKADLPEGQTFRVGMNFQQG